MRGIRPFGWVIIILNVYFIFSFFSSIESTDSSSVVGFAFFIWMIWLAVMNTVLYVLYRVTAKGKSRLCPACAKKVKVGLTNCGNCGFDFMRAATGIDNPSKVETNEESHDVTINKTPIDKKSTAIALIVILIVCIYAFSQSKNGNSTTQVSQNTQTYDDNKWVPGGFVKWDEKVAYNYIENPNCSYSESICIGIQVISKDGCPNNLYGEISIEDKNGVQIGYTNDTLSKLDPQLKGELIFDILDWERFGGFKLSKLSCY